MPTDEYREALRAALNHRGIPEEFLDAALQVGEVLEALTASAEAAYRDGDGPHGDEWPTEARPLPSTVDGATAALSVAALILERYCADNGDSFPDRLRDALEDAELWKMHRDHTYLCVTRPGCWEASHIEHLTAGVGLLTHDEGLERLAVLQARLDALEAAGGLVR